MRATRSSLALALLVTAVIAADLGLARAHGPRSIAAMSSDDVPPPSAEPPPLRLPTPELDEPYPRSLRRPCAAVDLDTSDVERRQRADAHALQADARYMDGDVRGALEEIDVAQCYWPHPDYDFMRGVLFASLGECAEARAAMQRFFDTEPNEVDARAARERLGDCGPVLPPPPPRADPPGKPAVPETFLDGPFPAPVASTPRPLTARDEPGSPRPVWRDPVGGALLGTGAPCLLAGTGLLVAARATGRTQPATFNDFEAQLERQRKLRAAGGTLTALGSGAVLGAIIRYAWLATERKRHRGPDRRTAGR